MNTALDTAHNEAARTIRLTVPGMGSDHCAGIVRHTLEQLDGVHRIDTNIAQHRVTVTAGGDGPDGEALRRAVEGAGYDVAAVQGESDEQSPEEAAEIEHAWLKQAWNRFVFAAVRSSRKARAFTSTPRLRRAPRTSRPSRSPCAGGSCTPSSAAAGSSAAIAWRWSNGPTAAASRSMPRWASPAPTAAGASACYATAPARRLPASAWNGSTPSACAIACPRRGPTVVPS